MIYRSIGGKHLKWLYNHIGTFKKSILVSLILSVLAVATSLAFVEITKIFMEAVEKGENFSFLLLIFSLATIKGFSIFCAEGKSYIREKQTALMNNELSLKFFKQLFTSGVSYDAKVHSADSLGRLTTDAFSVANCLIGTIPELIYSFIQLIATCAYLMSIEPNLTLAILSIMSVNILIGQRFAKKLLPISREIRISDSKAHQFMQEHLQHRELIITLDKTSFIWNRLKSLQDKVYKKIIENLKLNTLMMSLVGGALDVSYIIILAWGIYGIQNGTFTYAELVVFLQLAEQMQIPFVQFNHYYPMFISSMASVERLMDIENMPKEDNKNRIVFSDLVGIRFSNAYFRYSENYRYIYREFNFDFTPGSVTAIVGETGAGKSTLLKLLLAVLKPTSGNVDFYGEIEGKVIVVPASPRTRGNCVYVPQGNSLISGTIRYNLLLGKTDATDKEMEEALYLAAADFVLKDFPNGLDTIVGEGGLGVSEGQAQRIAIARSFLRPGKVILMDEPTSALDNETEKLFLERLTGKSHGKTLIIVTHKQEICNYVENVVKIEPFKEYDALGE